MKTKIKPMTPGIPHNARVRAYLTGAIVTTALCGVAWSAWALQIKDGDRYREQADRQHAMNVEIPAPRGDVIDARGRPLAVSADADSVWANPRLIRDVTDTADKLAKIVGEDPAVLEAKLGGDRKFVWIDRHVTHEIAQAVRDARLPGIEVAKEPRRWYPGRSVGGPVIGRADIDSRGLDGIELSMDKQLQGERGAGLALRDARGRRMFANGMAQPEPGATVQLSLDRSIQAIADSALAEAVTTHAAKSGVVVVLDVESGHVLAMSSYPTFDPNGGSDHPAARNRGVTDAYEAGSVMKLFTIAAALDDGMVKPETELDVENGTLMIPGRRAPIRDVHPFKYLSVSDIIKHSSNVGAAKIALRLGRDKVYAAFKKYGFGAKTQIELPGEQVGRVRDGSSWRDVELATIAFGYGITVTPLQIAAGLAALGNGGVYHAPRIVDRVIDPDGTLLYSAQAEPRQMIKPATAEAMRKIMATVFEGGGKLGGTAQEIIVPGFRCGGKTGTAHKYDPATKMYAPDLYLSSFAGLAPIDKPRLAIVVMIDEPSGGDYYGGKVAGPVFATVASEALRYLGVPGTSLVCPPPVPGINPLLDPTVKTCTIPSPKVPNLTKAQVVIGEPELETSEPGEQAPPVLAPGQRMIPDFTGMGLARAFDLARSQRIAIDVSGSGQVVTQAPAPGPGLAKARIRLRFSDGSSPHAARSAPRP